MGQFNYISSKITEEGSRAEILSRKAQIMADMSNLRPIGRDIIICLKTKLGLLSALAIPVCLYSCAACTLTAEIQWRIHALEMRCYITIFAISYIVQITNEEVRNAIRHSVGHYEDLLTTAKKWKLKWYGHVIRANSLSTPVPAWQRQGWHKER